MYVLDSSVVLKWFILEDDSSVARTLRRDFIAGDIELAAPVLLLYEVGNILVRKKRIKASEAEKAVELLFQLGMTVSAPDVSQVRHAVQIAASTGASVYDSAYVALASDLGWPLITADRRLVELCGTVADIRLLSSF